MQADDKCTNDDLHVVPASEALNNPASDSSRSSSNHSIHKKDLFQNGFSLQWPASLADENCCGDVQPCPSPFDTTRSSADISGEEDDIDELDDMLRRFDTFFREKMDTELQSLQEFMHGFLTEQQIHLRQIMNSNQFSKHAHSYQQADGLAVQSADADYQKAQVQECLEETEMRMSEGTGDGYDRPANTDLLLELMSLSCELSALLSQPKFL